MPRRVPRARGMRSEISPSEVLLSAPGGNLQDGRSGSWTRETAPSARELHRRKEQYEASIAAVHPSRDSLPKGQIFHAAGASAGGWTIVAVHDSKESWERFRDTILMPRMKQGISGGFTTPPQETTFEVHNLVP